MKKVKWYAFFIGLISVVVLSVGTVSANVIGKITLKGNVVINGERLNVETVPMLGNSQIIVNKEGAAVLSFKNSKIGIGPESEIFVSVNKDQIIISVERGKVRFSIDNKSKIKVKLFDVVSLVPLITPFQKVASNNSIEGLIIKKKDSPFVYVADFQGKFSIINKENESFTTSPKNIYKVSYDKIELAQLGKKVVIQETTEETQRRGLAAWWMNLGGGAKAFFTGLVLAGGGVIGYEYFQDQNKGVSCP